MITEEQSVLGSTIDPVTLGAVCVCVCVCCRGMNELTKGKMIRLHWCVLVNAVQQLETNLF